VPDFGHSLASFRGSTGTGLDQIVESITNNAGLQNRISIDEITGGAKPADGLNSILVESILATGAAGDGDISASEVVDINAYIRANHATEWADLYGDDVGGVETGYHLVLGDGGNGSLIGNSPVETVGPWLYNVGRELDGIFFEVEDGEKVSSIYGVARVLNELLEEDLDAGTFDQLV
jgi:hypothetical protein